MLYKIVSDLTVKIGNQVVRDSKGNLLDPFGNVRPEAKSIVPLNSDFFSVPLLDLQQLRQITSSTDAEADTLRGFVCIPRVVGSVLLYFDSRAKLLAAFRQSDSSTYNKVSAFTVNSKHDLSLWRFWKPLELDDFIYIVHGAIVSSSYLLFAGKFGFWPFSSESVDITEALYKGVPLALWGGLALSILNKFYSALRDRAHVLKAWERYISDNPQP